ncbi:MAG: hypothetical protein KDB07_07730, partial [Planctomycetes bacterium]|nr:hypothetical protein [Planctomycetota bacterium]
RPSAKVSGDKYPGWTAESLTLDTVPFLVKNGKVITARAKLAELMLYTSERADYWEKRSLEKVRGALEGFLELESRRQGQYHYILRDIGLAHVAIGNFYLQNEIDRAREVVKKQDWWYRVPETRQDEALLSFLQDEVRFPSSVRAAMNREFSEGTRWLSEFVEEDLVAERTRNDRVNERIFAASEAGEVDAIDQENLDLHKRAVAIFQAEQASLRKRIILQVLTLMIYPQFGMERLEEALVMVNRLEVTDPQDPITFLIRGVIYQRKREFENAMREFDLFISKSSVATDGPRITFARRERIACELEVEAALRKKD